MKLLYLSPQYPQFRADTLHLHFQSCNSTGNSQALLVIQKEPYIQPKLSGYKVSYHSHATKRGQRLNEQEISRSPNPPPALQGSSPDSDDGRLQAAGRWEDTGGEGSTAYARYSPGMAAPRSR